MAIVATLRNMLAAALALVALAWLRLVLPVIVSAGIALGLMSKDRRRWLARRQAKWHFLEPLDSGGKRGSSGWSWGSAVSVAGQGFSGAGGSFGGGGASGSW